MNATLERALVRIMPVDESARQAALRELDDKTKPRGSLGRLEELAARLAAIHGTTRFATRPRAVVVMAADHGVAARGVSAYPQAVTEQMVLNFAAGGAAVNVLARQVEAETVIVDMVVAGDHDWPAPVRRAAVAKGTRDLAEGPAMTEAEAERALESGLELADGLVGRGMRVLATGEMGIANTTSAAALTSVFTAEPPERVVGAGTGIDAAGLARKVEVVRAALDLHRPRPDRPLEALAKLGGFEIAGLAGLILGGAGRRIPVVIDGYIAGAAALVAVAFAPAVSGYLVAGHRSAEGGHRATLAKLGLEPLLDLSLRLGEGTGAVLALPLLDAAAAILCEMASFDSAGVSRKTS